MAKRPIWVKILFFSTLSIIFVCVIIFLVLLKIKCDIDKKENEKIVVTIDNPDCFLPKIDQDIKMLLGKIKKNPKWHIYSREELKNPDLKNIIAYRESDFLNKTTLIKTGDKVNKWITSEADCSEKKINLEVHYDLKSSWYRSNLLIKNDPFGLSITEWSRDRERKFTKDALRIVRDEMSKFQ